MSGRAAKMVALALATNNNGLNINDMEINVPYEIAVFGDNINYYIKPDGNSDLTDGNSSVTQRTQNEKKYNQSQIALTEAVPNDSAFEQIGENSRYFKIEVDSLSTIHDGIEDDLYCIQKEVISIEDANEVDVTQNMPMKNSNEDPDYILIEHQRETEDEEDENKENESEDYENEENGNSENEHEENENTYENKVDNENLRKKRKKVADPEAWEKNVNKRKRMLGQKYTGYSRTKDGIVKHDKTRCARETGPRCTSKFCEKATNRY
ncbi:uncharacterized protein [Leptinotarsa decemlineata]|uniref:uncharacterized protein n=1 Tax=Leptinotarsa decemlineata TaxID=7539 RepID=UPI003D307D4D